MGFRFLSSYLLLRRFCCCLGIFRIQTHCILFSSNTFPSSQNANPFVQKTLWLSNVLQMLVLYNFLLLLLTLTYIILPPQLHVLSPMALVLEFAFGSSPDPTTRHLETLIASGFIFTTSIWLGGDSSLPPLKCSRRCKLSHPTLSSSNSDTDGSVNTPPRSRTTPSCQHSAAVNRIVDEKFRLLRDSLIEEMRQLINLNRGCHVSDQAIEKVSSSTLCRKISHIPSWVTRSGYAGQSATSSSERSTNHKPVIPTLNAKVTRSGTLIGTEVCSCLKTSLYYQPYSFTCHVPNITLFIRRMASSITLMSPQTHLQV